MTGVLPDSGAVCLSQRARQLPGGGIRKLFMLARDRHAIDLAVGTPSAPHTPPELLDQAINALRSGRNQYEDSAGEVQLRRRIASSFTTPTDPDSEITITAGGTEALFVALLTTVDPGDEVVVFEPFFEGFVDAITLAGAIPRFVTMRPPDWRWDSRELAAAFSLRTRAVVLNSPNNPTGRALTRAELDELAALCRKWGVTAISDEVYGSLVFTPQGHVSVADLPELAGQSIVVGSLSKSHAISGWRLGYLRADAARTRHLRRVHEVTTKGTSAPLQFAAGAASVVGSKDWRPLSELAARRDVAQRILAGMGWWFRPADGGCFLFADISAVTSDDCNSYSVRLLEERGVLTVPGSLFYADPADGARYLRIAFNRTMATLEAAERRLLGDAAITEE